jgi:hypothetical protein
MASTNKKLAKLVDAVRANPNSNEAWGALVCESYETAEAIRDLLVARGEMTLIR